MRTPTGEANSRVSIGTVTACASCAVSTPSPRSRASSAAMACSMDGAPRSAVRSIMHTARWNAVPICAPVIVFSCMKRGRRMISMSRWWISSSAARFSSLSTALTLVFFTVAVPASTRNARISPISPGSAAASCARSRATPSSLRRVMPASACSTCANTRQREPPAVTSSSRIVRLAPHRMSTGATMSSSLRMPRRAAAPSICPQRSGGFSAPALPMRISRSRARVMAT